MGTYCKNHILERVDQYTDQAKNGEVTLRKTNGGTCGHLGGCNTNHEQKYELRYEYVPSEADRAKVEAAAEEAKLDTEKEADAKAKAEDAKQQAATSGSETSAKKSKPKKTPEADAPPAT